MKANFLADKDFYIESHQWASSLEYSDRNAFSPEIKSFVFNLSIEFGRKKYIDKDFALNNSNSEVAPYLAVYEMPNTTVRYLDTIYKTLTAPIKESMYGKLLKETIDLRTSAESN